MIDPVTPPELRHDPGGKVRLQIDPTIKSQAVFSQCGRYRQLLVRTWDSSAPPVLFIGMNPSTADAYVDDPTVRRECNFARDWGFGSLVKTNVMDYRATCPGDLLVPGVAAQTEANLEEIQRWVHHCPTVVVAWGRIPSSLQHCVTLVKNILQKSLVHPQCLGRNLDRSPRHPLYLKRNSTLEPFEW